MLNEGRYCLKGITFSGNNPPLALSVDSRSIDIAGMKKFSEEDVLILANYIMWLEVGYVISMSLSLVTSIPIQGVARSCFCVVLSFYCPLFHCL